MKTLIVGCGFLGLRAGRLLRQRGDRVFGTTRRVDRADELAAWGIDPLVGDVLDPGSFGTLPAVDRVLYCVGFDRAAGASIGDVYVEGPRNVLAVLPESVRKVVYVSSTGVYGQDDGGWIDEDAPCEPRTDSGRACLEAEGVVQGWAEGRGREAVIVRYAGLYGPGRIIRRANIERGEPIAGDPGRFLNMIHIDDAAEVAAAALERGRAGRVYLAADDRPVRRREYYERVAAHLGAPAPRFEPPEPGSPEARREGANKRVANGRMKAELGVALRHPDVATGVPAALDAAPGP